MEQHAGRTLPISLTLSKRIPVGGGLGGGSSDAAAMFLGLNSLFDLRIPHQQLRELSRPLGSDIAFFIDTHSPPRPAIVTGLGDGIERIAPSAAAALLIIPPFGCPTGPVYKAFDSVPARPLRDADIRRLSSESPAAAELFNDLLPAAESTQPPLKILRQHLAAAIDLPVHMSGSGSTLFILAPRPLELPVIAARVRTAAPEAACHMTRLI
jgi:4-diphosphocytidyl-2-C-methyl-D-erythritol kinase